MIRSDASTIALNKLGPVPKSVLDVMRIREWSAFESFKTGPGTVEDLKIATELLTLCQCCIDSGIGIEAQIVCIDAGEVLSQGNLHLKTGNAIRLSEVPLAVLRVLHDFHDQQRELCSLGLYAKMIDDAEIVVQLPTNKKQNKGPRKRRFCILLRKSMHKKRN